MIDPNNYCMLFVTCLLFLLSNFEVAMVTLSVTGLLEMNFWMKDCLTFQWKEEFKYMD